MIVEVVKIIWSEPAISDLENIRDYIANDSEYYAAIFIEKIIVAVEKVAAFPVRWTRRRVCSPPLIFVLGAAATIKDEVIRV